MTNPYTRAGLELDRKARSGWRFWLYVLSRLPNYLFWLVGDFFPCWRSSRDNLELGKALLLGLPALLAFLAALAFAYNLILKREIDLAPRYLRLAEYSTYFEDYHVATICYRRLIQREDIDPQAIFRGALIAEELGNDIEKDALIAKVTSGENDYGPAHVYLARKFLEDPSGPRTDLAKQEFERALQLDSSLVVVHVHLGHLLMDEGKFPEAIAHFETAAASVPEAALSLASLHDRQGNQEAAIRWADQADRIFARHEAASDEGTKQHQLAVVRRGQALGLKNRFPDALSKLQTVYAESGDNQVGKAVAEVCAQWSRELLTSQDTENALKLKGQGIRLLGKAIDISPTDSSTLSLLSELVFDKDSDVQLDKRTLESLLARGETPWLLHWIAGVRAWQMDLTSSEKTHFTFALELNPKGATPILAHTIYRACGLESMEIEEALRLLSIVEGIDRSPAGRLVIAEVRGLLFRQKKLWWEAIGAYEAALAINEARSDLHLALARAYEEVGRDEETRAHKQRADELEAEKAQDE